MNLAIRIFIDQGHNPTNPNSGAEGNGLREQDLTYEIGLLLAGLLQKDPAFEVMLSRNSPVEQIGFSNSTSLSGRVNAANAWNADYFISLHANASTDPNATGIEGFAYSTRSDGFFLGEKILDALSEETDLKNRGMFARPTLYVLRKTQMPAVLIEMGFITNVEDADLMNSEPMRFAEGIYRGIKDYFSF